SEPALHAFVAPVQEQLHAQADAQQRTPSAREVAERVDQPRFGQTRHARVEGTDTGQKHLVDRGDLVRRADRDGLCADALEHVADGTEIAQPVIDDADRHAAFFTPRLVMILAGTRSTLSSRFHDFSEFGYAV